MPGAKTWKVEAIHVTTTRNKRKFTRAELEKAGTSLSFRPLNINHDESRGLPFPENATLSMEFDSSKLAVFGKFRVLDPTINALIETNRINQVSIEQIPTKGETCNEVMCEHQDGEAAGDPAVRSDACSAAPEQCGILQCGVIPLTNTAPCQRHLLPRAVRPG